jgi:hypothetical protein
MIDGKATLLPQFDSLNYLVFLLNLESPSELLAYEGVAAAAGEFDVGQVKSILRQRRDFDREVIEKLRISR